MFPRQKPATFRPESVPLVAGATLLLLATIVLFGWVLHIPLLVQVVPDAAPMRFNTALLMFGVGLGFAALSCRSATTCRGLGFAVSVLASLTLCQNLFAVDWGIDNYLCHDWTQGGPHRSRMAINTAICFVLTGATLLSLACPQWSRWQPFLECLFGSTVFNVGIASAFGYSAGLQGAYGWDGSAGMAIHTSLAFAIAGMALAFLALNHHRTWTSSSPHWLPLPIGVTVLTITLVMWHALEIDQVQQAQLQATLRAQKLASQVETRLRERVQSMERMANRWSTAGRPTQKQWQADAAMCVKHYSDFRTIAWVDPAGKIQWMVPLGGSETVLGRNLMVEESCRQAISAAREQRTPMFTPVIDLLHGEKGVVVYCPIYRGNTCEGCLSAALRVEALMNELSSEDQESGYLIAAFDQQQQIYGANLAAQTPKLSLGESLTSYRGLSWRVCVWPSPQLGAAGFNHLPTAVLIGGCILAVLLALMVFLAQRAREQSRAAERAAAALRDSEWRFRAIFDQTFQFIGLLTTNGTLVEANRTALQFAGLSETDVLGKPFWETPWWSHSAAEQHKLRVAIASAAQGEFVRFETTHVAVDGSTRWVDFSLKPVYDNLGQICMLVPEGRDITDRKQAEIALTRAARLDKLTGLPNRGLLLDRLQQILGRAKRTARHDYAVMFLDFDRFKLINDTLGHEVGDGLLKEIAVRLQATVRSVDSVSRSACGNTTARLGGDEFVVLLDHLEQPADAFVVADRLLESLAHPYRIGPHEIYSTASIGIVLGDSSYDHAPDMLRDADTAMYVAKSTGKARYVAFDASMRQRLQHRLQLESDLRRAAEGGQLCLVYQPILSLLSGEVRSVEALLRWEHPTKGRIDTAEFISIAEESDLILSIGEWALETGCRQMADWVHTLQGAAPTAISINLSRKQFANPDLVKSIQRILAQTGLEPQRLQLEVTEEAVGSDQRTAIATMQAIRALGVRFVLDNFGAGCTSFAALHRFPIDVLKVDRTVLHGIENSRDSAALIHALAVLVKNLGIDLVAEGVETIDQAITLQELLCHSAQGFYLAEPMPPSKLEHFVSRSVAIDHEAAGAMTFQARWAKRLSLQA